MSKSQDAEFKRFLASLTTGEKNALKESSKLRAEICFPIIGHKVGEVTLYSDGGQITYQGDFPRGRHPPLPPGDKMPSKDATPTEVIMLDGTIMPYKYWETRGEREFKNSQRRRCGLEPLSLGRVHTTIS